MISHDRKSRVKKRLRCQFVRQGKDYVTVSRSNQHIYVTYVPVSSDQKTITMSTVGIKDLVGGNVKKAAELAKLFAAKLQKEGVEEIVFNRSGYRYHGWVKSLADGLRSSGFQF
ncbi:MAG: 50S ribosomal protein L18 [Candidatus Comchoanobacterales bacterium]